MSKVHSIKIGKDTYNLAEASAVQQKTLLSLIGSKAAMFSASSEVDSINTDFVKGMLLSLPEETFDQISDIVLYKCVKSGGKDLITIDNFQSGMNAYLELVAMGVTKNLADFFTYLDGVNREARQKA